MDKKTLAFQKSKDYLYDFARKRTDNKFPGELGLNRIKQFLKILGNPQNKLKIIHIAGTSGKSSTAYLTSSLLQSQGFKVGLHLSPHLLNIRERCQINNKLLDEKIFVKYVNEIKSYIKEMSKTQFGKPTYFEVLVALAFYVFYKEKVDYAVIETGMGGTYDGTNCVDNKDKIAVITKIGLDHTKILGDTIAEIAVQKTGIIKQGNLVISTKQYSAAEKVIAKVCKDKTAKLNLVKNWKNIQLNLHGEYQKENCSLALKVVSLLSKRDKFLIKKEKINQVLEEINFTGRFETLNIKGNKIIIDAAHNPQKMLAFVTELNKQFPKKKFTFVIAFKKGKNYIEMLKQIIKIANKIIITSFLIDNQDLVHLSEDPEKIASELKKLNFKNYKIIKDTIKAVNYGLNQEKLIITGSMYLLSDIYPHLISLQNQKKYN